MFNLPLISDGFTNTEKKLIVITIKLPFSWILPRLTYSKTKPKLYFNGEINLEEN